MVDDLDMLPKTKGSSSKIYTPKCISKGVDSLNLLPNMEGLPGDVQKKMVCNPNLLPNRNYLIQNVRTERREAIKCPSRRLERLNIRI